MPARFVKEIVGYADPLSVRAGDALNVCISCDVPGEYDATLVRLISGDARPHGTGFREIAVDASLRGRYKAEQQPLLPGSYAVLPDLPATDAPTVVFYLYPTLLEPRDQTVIRGGNVRVAVNVSGLVVAIGDSRVEVAAALLERRWYRIAVAIGASIEVQIDGVPAASSERPHAELGRHTSWRVARRFRAAIGNWRAKRLVPATSTGGSKRCASTERRSTPPSRARISTRRALPGRRCSVRGISRSASRRAWSPTSPDTAATARCIRPQHAQ